MSEQKTFRCAVYTRKSSEEGLEQDFNSLEAQREACEAYIRSQSHEGWKLISERFDDGGFSGGNMDRPALARLMSLVRDGKIDVIVIYKIDRLTRSLADFARLAENFDKHQVSFVSVTQQFNTTTSMGRLMLNVLLSFAQFEREITGERIRDKIAASKKKGMWMGGPVPLGYEVQNRQLIINEAEAPAVRRAFGLYLEEGNVPALLDRLVLERIRTPVRVSAKGRTSGGRWFTRGHVYKLLSNPLYIGRIAHKGIAHAGQHPAIVDRATWDAVQQRLTKNTQGERRRRRRADPKRPLLADILFTESSARMIPAHATKTGRRYSYYVEKIGAKPKDISDNATGFSDDGDWASLGYGPDDGPSRPGRNRPVALRLPASEIDAVALDALRKLLSDPALLAQQLGDLAAGEITTLASSASRLASDLSVDMARGLIARAVVSQRRMRLELNSGATLKLLGLPRRGGDDHAGAPGPIIEIPLTFRRRGRQLKLTTQGASGSSPKNVDTSLVVVVARAFDWFERLSSGQAPSVSALAQMDGFDAGYVSHVLPLAFLSPAEIVAILAGQQPASRTADRLIWHEDIPLHWRTVG